MLPCVLIRHLCFSWVSGSCAVHKKHHFSLMTLEYWRTEYQRMTCTDNVKKIRPANLYKCPSAPAVPASTPVHTHTHTEYKDNQLSRPLDCRFLIGRTIIQRQEKDKDAAEKLLFTSSRSWLSWRSDLTYSQKSVPHANTGSVC